MDAKRPNAPIPKAAAHGNIKLCATLVTKLDLATTTPSLLWEHVIVLVKDQEDVL
jgi:hypothetical protein